MPEIDTRNFAARRIYRFCRSGSSNLKERRTLQFAAALACVLGATSGIAQAPFGTGPSLPSVATVSGPFILDAVTDPITDKSAFAFGGIQTGPTIITRPGSEIRLTYVNHLTDKSTEQCVDGTCMNMTNLHFHGLHVSPNSPQDDVITMMANPGESLQYRVEIPADQAPGLYWYHTHPHGESYQQSLDGMSAAIIINGIERYAPQVANLDQKLLILREVSRTASAVSSMEVLRKGETSPSCDSSKGLPDRVFTVNNSVRPKIEIAPGERQFWRIVNASPDMYADLTLDGAPLEVVAIDGMPLSFHDPRTKQRPYQHILLPPAGRVEAIITGPPTGSHASLRSSCVNTGSDGDPNPEMVLADLVDGPSHHDQGLLEATRPEILPARPHTLQSALLRRRYKDSAPSFTVKFTEDKQGFYINDKRYVPSDSPLTTVNIGGYQHWHIVNATKEIHPFHIHQVHFLTYAENGKVVQQLEWRDTINVPAQGSIDVVLDFTDPIIRGTSLFHCHLLKHEDKGMMAKIEFH